MHLTEVFGGTRRTSATAERPAVVFRDTLIRKGNAGRHAGSIVGLPARTDGSLTPAVTRATLAGRRPRRDLTPYRQPTRQEARGKALGAGLDQSGRRDLNPRPPEPHSHD